MANYSKKLPRIFKHILQLCCPSPYNSFHCCSCNYVASVNKHPKSTQILTTMNSFFQNHDTRSIFQQNFFFHVLNVYIIIIILIKIRRHISNRDCFEFSQSCLLKNSDMMVHLLCQYLFYDPPIISSVISIIPNFYR